MSELTHEQLWKVCQRKPDDYEPYGKRKRLKGTVILGDCAGGCKWYHTLSGPASLDWGVCGNPRSHRAGLLTFEHRRGQQGERSEQRREQELRARQRDACRKQGRK
jgi:hypothetical protein